MSSQQRCDFLIIGAGIIGLAMARELKSRLPAADILVIEKEADVAYHGSGRNSGVLHAGFYYSADSLKARFTRDGNRMMTEYVKDRGLAINPCHKVVVASDENEIEGVQELQRRGERNGVDVRIIDEQELAEIDPNAKTTGIALYSPTTATVDPSQVCHALKEDLEVAGVRFLFGQGYYRREGRNAVVTTGGMVLEAGLTINAAGLYADTVARDYGFSKNYTIIPFKGIYLKYTGTDKPIRTNIYPVPNLKNPFLGVHYTVTVDGTIKIGPTAIPAFWRQNYVGLENFSLGELFEIIGWESRLFLGDNFGFRSLALSELKKYDRSYFTGLAVKMVKQIDTRGFNQWSKPGIRAQLLNTTTKELVQDFVVEGDSRSVHLLNAVSPAFTCSFPFAAWVVDHYILKQ
ncbi:L-2-hydroxyglutarate oxidase LhgO [Trichlorobacter thiogenes]|uniref:L-2-hydroxyglutarate oxidase LhgO n=1 Tax=Trichlorobacter thiogenes TaxID=115783 RepID=A0A1T4RUT9_9BACT|nr:L-2-hydroxyglutarate oxidase [Trichlorobacter thiogenes]SKA19764.1 L-2-hydroxyglutarate oxidase LhgO [Trichlorobacter thiogenes]